VQQQADILFLGLAFDSPIPEVIRTSAPGKMGEYLGSGRPILVHAPPDSFLSWYFKKEEWGMVVDQKDATVLGRGIERLLEDGRLRKRLVQNALSCARRDFSLRKARNELLRVLQAIPGGQICESSS
jgi:glycosyltransferase involved in cell wall biosynthesis